MQVDERSDVTYEVTISVPDSSDGIPTEEEIKMAIYRGVRDIDTPHAVEVVRL